VQPFLALAVGLQKVGHQVKLAAPHRFESFVNSYEIPFVSLSGDPEVISQRLNQAGRNPIGMLYAIREYIFSIADQVAREAFAACDQADLIVHSFLFTTGGHSLACKLGIMDISVQTFPIFAPTRAIPPVSMPGLPPGWLSYFFHWLTTRIFWHAGNAGFRHLRKTHPEVFDVDLHWPFDGEDNRFRTPLLLAYSPTVVPRADDWSALNIHIPGYFFLDSPASYQPYVALKEFLSLGEPPVCVSFGSMIHRDIDRIYGLVLEAIHRTGNRAIVLSGWSALTDPGAVDLLAEQSAEDLFIDAIPHDWLLPSVQSHCPSWWRWNDSCRTQNRDPEYCGTIRRRPTLLGSACPRDWRWAAAYHDQGIDRRKARSGSG
jgi:UDP:flavonoid glycosyltransferase YjiC (YdhE family)